MIFFKVYSLVSRTLTFLQYLLTNVQDLDIHALCTQLKLNPTKLFGADVLNHCPNEVKNLDDMLNMLKKLKKVQISNLLVEYSCQDKDDVFASIQVEYDEKWLLEKVSHFEKYWTGERFAQGVDIEEAWKCSMCSFADNCDWRIAKAEELKKV